MHLKAMKSDLKAYIEEYYRFWATKGTLAHPYLSYGDIMDGIDKTARKPFVLDAGLASGKLLVLRFHKISPYDSINMRVELRWPVLVELTGNATQKTRRWSGMI
jgi:hypothetical protein